MSPKSVEIGQIVQGTASSVPEPVEWAMMLVGLGVMGAVLRRRHGAIAV